MRQLLRILVLCLLALPAAAQNYGLSPLPVQHFDTANGAPCSGCLLFTYQAGTTTKLNTYTDASGATPNANPIILNARGEAPVWIPGSTAYKFVLAPAGDNDPPSAPIWTVDQITTLTSASFFPGGGVAGNFITWNAGITALVDSGYNGQSFRNYSPGDFYVAPGGSDSNNCLAVGTPCLTVQQAVNLAMAYDWQGGDVTIHLAAGTYPKGALIGGPLPGAASGSFVGNKLIILGAGAASTTISVTDCSPTVHALNVGGGAYVGLGGVTLGTSCAGGSDLVVQQGSTVTLVDADVTFGAASDALIYVFDRSMFLGASNYKITLSGSATYAFKLSTHATVLLSAGATHVVSNTPTYSAFINAIDHSMWDPGINSTFSGAAVGARYSLLLNSVIDLETMLISQIPGDQAGNLSNGSYITNNSGNLETCVGGAVGCRVTTAPTGIGAGASTNVVTGSGDGAGVVVMTAGTGAAANGVIHVATPSLVTGPGHLGGFCTASIYASGASWDTRATVFPLYTAGDLTLNWDNNAVALTAAGAYGISYQCQ